MGAWIEIKEAKKSYLHCLVAPLMGAWIEIFNNSKNSFSLIMSRPSWARGLKSTLVTMLDIARDGRAPHGRVD